jgi:hypothetical protein
VTLLAIIKSLLSFADGLMKYLGEGQLLEAGKAIRDAENFKKAIARVEQADAAAAHIRELINSQPDGLLPDDPFTIKSDRR